MTPACEVCGAEARYEDLMDGRPLCSTHAEAHESTGRPVRSLNESEWDQ